MPPFVRQTTLWAVQPPTSARSQAGNPALQQFFTPEWAAVELVARHFADLDARDRVVEPTCGRGSFLKAVPSHVEALGVEIDPALAADARHSTGRPVLCGDIRTIELPWTPTVFLGNPPFQMDLVETILARARELLPDYGRCGFILPSSAIQTPSRVNRWRRDWSLLQEALPRTLFPGSRSPLLFAVFTKDGQRRLWGFALFEETAAIAALARETREVLVHGRPGRSVWRAVVEEALERLGGSGDLDAIYRAIEPRRPTGTRWWREKVRQMLQRHCEHRAPGHWALATSD